MSPSSRRAWAWPAALAALAAFPFAPVLLSGGALVPGSALCDILARFLPIREFGFAELKAGRLALWNPRLFAGVPNLGGFESALLYPPNWLHLILPAGLAVSVLAAAHAAWAALGTFAWCRRRGASPEGSALAGLSFAFSGAFFPHFFAGHLGYLFAASWAPAVFLCVDAWLDSRAWGWLAALAAAGSLQLLAGNPQASYATALFAAAYAALRLSGLPRGARLPSAAGLVAAGLWAAAACAAQLWTGWDAARESVRAALETGTAASFSLPPENLLTALAPGIFGDLAGLPYHGRWYYWEVCVFLSAPALLLAAAPAREKRERPLFILAGLALLLALGRHVPLHALASQILPGFALFRAPSKFSLFLTLFLCALAARGWDKWRSGPRPGRLAFGVGLLALLAALGATAAAVSGVGWVGRLDAWAAEGIRQTPPPLFGGLPFAEAAVGHAARELAASAAVLAACAALLTSAARRRGWAAGLLALAAVQGLLFARRQMDAAPAAPIVPPSWESALPGVPPEERLLVPWERFPNAAMRLKKDELWGYEQLVPRRYAELMAVLQGQDPAAAGLNLELRRAHPLLALLRAGWVFDERGGRRLPWKPFPRAFLAGDWEVAKGRDEVFSLLSAPGFDSRRTVVLEEEPFARPTPRGKARGRVEARADGTDAVEISAELEAPALLVVTDGWAPGWRVVSLAASPQDGYRVMPADWALRAVPLSAGRHRIRLEYAPLSWRLGRWISAAAWAALAAALLYSLFAQITGWRKKR